MSKRAISICLAAELNKLLEAALHSIQTKLTVCASEDEAHRAMVKSSYCLIIIAASVLTTERAQKSLERMRQNTYAPILILAPDNAAERLLRAGADICLSDTAPPEAVVSHALALLRRYTLYNHYDIAKPEDAVLHRRELVIDPLRHRVTLSGEEINLRRREFRLLLCFARNPGIVLTPEQICEKVWMTEYDYNRDVSSVIAVLRRKLKDRRENPVYIETVHGVGYRFLPQK